MPDLIATAAATALLLSGPAGPGPDTSATPATATAETESQTASLSRSLFERGLAEYEAGDYEAAVLHWSSAYDLMASDAGLARARRVLAFDLGQAHMRAYDVDSDRAHLTAARPLLQDYMAWVDRPAHTMSSDEREDRARAEEMLARVDILQGAPPPPEAAPRHADEPSPLPPPPSKQRNGTGLIVGGAVSMTLGVGLLACTGIFVARGRRAEADYVAAQDELTGNPNGTEATNDLQRAEFDGAQANAGMIGCATIGSLMLAGGVAMVTTGAVLRKRARRLAVAPTFSRTEAGAVLRVRF
jgi:hypothetical protein